MDAGGRAARPRTASQRTRRRDGVSVELNLGHEALVTGCVYAVLLTFSSVPRGERRSLGGQ